MERRQIEHFVGVMDHLNITRAAAALHVSQPALSRSIQALERELGTTLFTRTQEGIVPTEAAHRILGRARAILGDFGALRSAATFGDEVVGEPRVALTGPLAHEPMTSIVADLRERHPGVRTVGVASQNASEALASVVRGTSEIAIFGQQERPTNQPVMVQLLMLEELKLVLPPNSSLAGAGRIDPAELRGLPFIAAPPHTVIRRLLDRLSDEVGIRIVAEAAHRDAIPSMVGRGVGLAILPATLRELVHGLGGSMRGLQPAIEVPVWIAHHEELSTAGRAVVQSAHRVAGRAP